MEAGRELPAESDQLTSSTNCPACQPGPCGCRAGVLSHELSQVPGRRAATGARSQLKFINPEGQFYKYIDHNLYEIENKSDMRWISTHRASRRRDLSARKAHGSGR